MKRTLQSEMRAGLEFNNVDFYVRLICECYEMTKLVRHTIADPTPQRCFVENIYLF